MVSVIQEYREECGQWIVGVISFQKIYGLYGQNILQSDLNGPRVEKLE